MMSDSAPWQHLIFMLASLTAERLSFPRCPAAGDLGGLGFSTTSRACCCLLIDYLLVLLVGVFMYKYRVGGVLCMCTYA